MSKVLIKKGFRVALVFLAVQALALSLLFAVFNVLDWPHAGSRAPKTPELVVYAYDSFLAPGGLGAQIIPLFEKKFDCHVRALASGDATQLLTRLELDAKRGKPTAHVVVGVDQQLWERVKKWVEPWGSWTPLGYEDRVEPSLKRERGFLPYDYGVFALMMDRLQMEELKIPYPPGGVMSIRELLDPKWKRNIILEDPRTSTPGLAFLLYSAQVLQGDTWTFWEKFRGQWLTLTPGWGAAYGLFLKKEAPFVWSYTTSQAYHREMAKEGERQAGKPPRYQAILFKEGQPYQIEGAVLIKGAFETGKSPQLIEPGPQGRGFPRLDDSRKLAQKFLEYLISPEVQKMVPKKAWMMPVLLNLKNTEVPVSFRDLPRPLKWVETQTDIMEMTKLLSRWKETVGRSF